MSRSGFFYSLFAIMMIGLIFNVTVLPVLMEPSTETGERIRVSEVSHFLSSIEDDFDRSTEIIGRRAFTSLTNRIISNGSYLAESKQAYKHSFNNGTINGIDSAIMQDASFEEWSGSMVGAADDSGYDFSTNITSMALETSPPVTVEVTVTHNLTLSDDITDTTFQRSTDTVIDVAYTGLEDPLVLLESAGRYSHTFKTCGASDPAGQVSTGGSWFYQEERNWTSGAAVTRPENGGVSSVDGKSEKVAVVDDLCSYDDITDFSGFEGVVSEAEAIDGKQSNSKVDACGDDSTGIDALVDGAEGAADSIDQGSTAVLNEEEVWQNELKNWTEESCYFADGSAPTLWERMDGEMSSDGAETGTASLISIDELPVELQEQGSAVDYVYFNDSGEYGDLTKVKGVTNEGLDWFRLDQEHVDDWGINSLTFE